MTDNAKLVDILLVEDNEGDVVLTLEAFEQAKFRNTIHVVRDGDLALDFLFKRGSYTDAPRPDIILLDLNLPRTDGREILEAVKSDPELKSIPVVVLTSSDADRDIVDTYDRHANCYIVKPIDPTKFISVVQTFENFWIDVVQLPSLTVEPGAG